MIPERFRPVVEEVAPLAERFAAAGKRVYLVGGIVRDGFVGRPGGGSAFGPDSDVDLTTDARPDEIEAIVRGWADALWLQGKAFGTIGCTHAGRRFEITTHRAEAYSPDSRKPEVRFGDDVAADLARRDFTVNAMALELPSLELSDPHGGLADLAAGRLRTPLDPEESFSDDPLRMLRAARFAAGYGLEPAHGLVEAIERLAARIEIVSAERVRDELDKLLVVPSPDAGIWLVVRTGLAAHFLPELPALALEQDPVHRHKDVLAHTIAVVERAKPDPHLFLAAAELLGVDPRHSFVVGDSIWDLMAAQRAGALGVGLLSGGYGRAELAGAGDYRVYADPAEMLERLEEVGVRPAL